MYAQCPHCQAVFRVTTPELTRADGYVRCGQCNEVFNAMDALRAMQPEATPRAREARTEDEVVHDDIDAVLDIKLDDIGDAHDFPDAIPESLSEDLKPTGTGASTHSLAATLLWSGGILLLIAVLAAQYAQYNLQTLYQHPELQPLLQTLCKVTGCKPPPRKDRSRIELVNRNIYSHPNTPGALMISATLVNNAPFAQPYPLVGIRMSNIQGETIAMRRFTPEEYLPAPPLPGTLMEPGAPVYVNLEIIDPGSEALAFEFEFL